METDTGAVEAEDTVSIKEIIAFDEITDNKERDE
jgi:hypothetical protein